MAKLKTYHIQADIKTLVSIEIKAENMRDAIAQSEALQVQDFITIDGEYIDGELDITGIYS